MKLRKIQIRNFRGIETLDVEVPPAGVIAKGGNARGKTTLLKAVRSVLEARDISSDAIRLDTDRAEILVDLDNVSVKRVITSKTSTLSVERDGLKASKPTTYLRELLGSASLDPLELYLAKPKERRGLILAALPCRVPTEQLRKYIGELPLPLDFDANGHALEVIEKARAHFYGERTLANREADEAARTVDRLASEATKAATAVTPGPLLPADEARADVLAAERELLAIEARATEARAAETRTASQREQIAKLRATADEQAQRFAGEPVETGPLAAAVEDASAAVEELRRKLADAEAVLVSACTKLDQAKQTNRIIDAARTEIAAKRAQADALEQALAAATVAPPAPGAIEAAQAKLTEARATLDRAALQAAALAAVEAAEAAKKNAASLKAEADELDQAVKRLANDAPRELLASTDGIPGLGLDGDDVTLDGVRLSERSSAQQMQFAIEIARRANAKTKILVVDGLERIDMDQREAFVAHATRDDWQLIGSLVTGGELVVAAIEPEETAAAAE